MIIYFSAILISSQSYKINSGDMIEKNVLIKFHIENYNYSSKMSCCLFVDVIDFIVIA